MKQLVKLIAVLAIWVMGSLAAVSQADGHGYSDYQRVSGISGTMSSVGSDTLANLMALWSEEFKNIYPSVAVQIQAAGSSTAPPALIAGSSSFGPMSRPMKDSEVAEFEAAFGYKPTGFPVAIDALAVFVHKDNPIAGMTMEQVDAVFSSTLRCGAAESIEDWGELGLSGGWDGRPIQLFGRNSASGTYGYFKDNALCKGDYKSTVNEQPGSSSVVQSINDSRNAIGYSGIGYLTAGVRAVALGETQGDYIEATGENAAAGTYPLSRFLYVYVNKNPNEDLPPLEREFIKLIYSSLGQEVVTKDGYVPLPQAVIEENLRALGIDLET